MTNNSYRLFIIFLILLFIYGSGLPRTFAFLVFKNSLEKSLYKDSANQQLSSISNTQQTRHGTNASESLKIFASQFVQAITVFNFAGHIKIQLLPRILKLLVKGRNNSQHCCANSFACCCVLVAVVFNRMQQHATKCSRVCKRTQHVASNNVASVCSRLLSPLFSVVPYIATFHV